MQEILVHIMDIQPYFQKAIDSKASDLHLVAGCVPTMRVNGELVKMDHIIFDGKELKNAFYHEFSDKKLDKFEEKKDHDFSYNFGGLRFRINMHYQEGQIALAARVITKDIPKPEELGFDETIYKLTHLKDGLILVTGPSGSGKSTTLAAMINLINMERRSHIITIEDPIEYLFTEEQSIIEQRELGIDTDSFAKALKYALRQDPNVIMVGEMRDQETINAALTAAETGHLVISTLHTSSAVETIQRIVDAFPSQQHQQVLNLLSLNLRAVIAQQLLPKIRGGVVVAREIMINNQALANLIRNNQIGQIYSIIETGQREGMIPMNKSIDRLRNAGIISEEVAHNRKRNLETKAIYY
jgi:twitching motility protein PilT